MSIRGIKPLEWGMWVMEDGSEMHLEGEIRDFMTAMLQPGGRAFNIRQPAFGVTAERVDVTMTFSLPLDAVGLDDPNW
jgi:hypothetical protein